MDKKAIDYLQEIVGRRISYVVRSCELVCIGIGDLNTIESIYTKRQRKIAEFSLHFLAPFRIEINNKIRLGYDDLFVSSNPDSDVVDLNLQDSTLFDSVIKNCISELKSQVITDVILSENGDIEIILSSGKINSFICSTRGEAWRFFRINSENHLIASCNQIEIE